MTARDPLWTQNSGPTGILDVSDVRVGHAASFTPGAGSYQVRSGFRLFPYPSPFVTATGTPNGFVHVPPFQFVLQSTRLTTGGAYVLTFDATTDVNILSTPANATNPRDDLIIAQLTDTFHGDGSSAVSIVQVVGTPAGSPSDPAVPGSTDYVVLARVRVAANATSISQANITDLRTSGHAKSLTYGMFTAAAGGIVPVKTTGERDLTYAAYPGQAFWVTDDDALDIWSSNLPGFKRILPYPYWVEKSVDTARANNTIADDPHLVSPTLPAFSVWKVELLLYYLASNAASVSGIKMGFTGPSGCHLRWQSHNKIDTDAVASATSTWFADLLIGDTINSGGGGATPISAHPQGLLKIGATPGTLAFRWSQATTNAGNPTTVRAGSSLLLTKVL